MHSVLRQAGYPDRTFRLPDLKKTFRAIERIRNDVAHANNYAMAFKQAKKLRATLGDLIELRRRINSFAR